MSESAFIESLRAIALHSAARGLLDDAAVLEVGGARLVLTHDMLVEGVHFLPSDPPEDVAWKLVAVNLSDLAAKGARPVGVLVGYSLGEEAWDAAFAKGLGEALAALDTPLLGGDTVSMPAGKAFGLTAVGEAQGEVPSRSGAKPGDSLWVTGTIGDGMMGHALLTKGDDGPPSLIAAYRRPQPRLAEGALLAQLVHAMMDVSDGLLLDARRMAQASGCSVDIDSASVPFSAEFDSAGGDRRAALAWGDDYELLFAAPAGFEPPVPATLVGRFGPPGEPLLRLDGAPLPASARLGWEHR
jgi:thiamine-monophosphate kinase